MAALTWDATGTREYETGVDRGVVYPYDTTNNIYSPGVAWNGLTGIEEKPSGAEAKDIWADNMKYLELRGAEKFGITIKAYTYPDEFAVLDGSASLATGVYGGQQKRGVFGLCYRTRKGNDTQMDDHGYKLHLVYGLTVSPSEKSYDTVNDDPEAVEFSWEGSSTPVTVAGSNYRPMSTIVIDSTKADSTKLAALEAKLYGGDNTDPVLPLPATVIQDMT